MKHNLPIPMTDALPWLIVAISIVSIGLVFVDTTGGDMTMWDAEGRGTSPPKPAIAHVRVGDPYALYALPGQAALWRNNIEGRTVKKYEIVW